MKPNTQSALVIIDYINEIIDIKGKLAGKGYATYVAKHGTLAQLASALAAARTNKILRVFVRVGFHPAYVDHPEGSPLFGGAKKFGALQQGTWATEFIPQITPQPDEIIVNKNRVSAFHATNLDLVLRKNNVKEVFLAGVATDLAVQSAARDAHDRDFSVTVLSDCCAAATDEDHINSLMPLAKIARVAKLTECI